MNYNYNNNKGGVSQQPIQGLKFSRSHQQLPYRVSSVILFTTVPWLADFMYGYDCGAISYAILSLSNDNKYNDAALSATWIGVIVATAALGALVASTGITILGFPKRQEQQQHDNNQPTTTTSGRKPPMGYIGELQCGATLYLVGAVLQASSARWLQPPQSQNIGLLVLLLGRFLYGWGIGISMHAAPAYLGEMSPASIRGFCLAMKEAANTVGVLVGYQIGHHFHNSNGAAGSSRWAWSFLCCTAFSATSLLLSLALPDSPRWLLLHDQDAAARASLQFLYRDTETAQAEYQAIKQHMLQNKRKEQQLSSDAHKSSDKQVIVSPDNDRTKACLWRPLNRRALFIGVGIVALQQITGSPSMLAYASTVFEQAGQASNSSVHMATFQLAVTLLAVGLVDVCGRRWLLTSGCLIMALALMVLAVSYGWHDDVVLWSMFLYIGGFQLGFGPIAWLVVAEIFSNELRAKATALCVQINFLSYGMVQFAVPLVSAMLGFNGTFAVFAALSWYSVYFIYAYIPETSGLSLEAIDTQMEQASKTSKDKQNVNEAEALLASQQLVQQQLDYGSLVAV